MAQFWEFKQHLLHEQVVYQQSSPEELFNVLTATAVRNRTPMTAIFISVYNRYNIETANREFEKISYFLSERIRQSDMLFELNENLMWCILMSHSGEDEANAFIKRINSAWSKEESGTRFVYSIAEIRNKRVEFDDLIEQGENGILMSLNRGAGNVVHIHSFKEMEKETIKVSVIDQDEILREVLKRSVENLDVPPFQMEIRLFEDGYDFLQSDWYHSSHCHILIMNDVLPRKNGTEIMHALRKMPNQKKFIIFMMTKRNAEDQMIYSYETGVDEYLLKPFNIRLFEARIRRVLKRLWQ